ncbi:synaptogenesis protein syg-2 [Nilaparvata lugens]|uniref:synaptogenesis protein syg-2 n=1 Tax=Nilaparvata lugens TaxID=108931 RepID=UPI00193CFD20|nr:synaptogenesis protein syg-2 [Nilaparvata lugens]
MAWGFAGICWLAAAAAARLLVAEQQVVSVDVQAVEGKSVELPCNVTPPGHDKLYMVFWFRDNVGIPLYSFDMRGKPMNQAKHWSDREVFGDRAYFRTQMDPARLVVESIRRHDEGLYRCRVDFRNTPTRSFRYNLTVIVPPEYPLVMDAFSKTVNSTLGPYVEGSNVTLTCRVTGGKPEPVVRWLVNGNVVDSIYEHNAGNVIENRHTWLSLRRRDLHSVFSCQASNTELTDPKETSLVLDLLLKPLTAKIMSKPTPLKADERYEVKCESAGSKPPAVITWYKGKKTLRKVKDEFRDNKNVTISTLMFTPTTEDDGKVITCRAENPQVQGQYQEELWTIQVVYPPIVSLWLGSTLNASDIKEGDDVYFECHVKSNPPWRKLAWYHNGVLLSHNASARLILINQSLVLQKVTRQNAGIYECLAVNQEGETRSNNLTLRVKYAPTCKQDRILVVGASRSENLHIVCEVEADPPAKSFRWKFNNSGETMDVEPERYTTNGTTSLLYYTPVVDLDYGTLSCWADNAIGQQISPCVFQVVVAGKPFPVRNCTLSNQTMNSVEVSCVAGFDGGLPQQFLLELYSADSAARRYNVTSDAPYFLLLDLEPDVIFRIVIYAVNSKGRSQGVFLEEITFSDAEKRTASDADIAMSWLGIALGAGLTVLTIICFLLMMVRRQHHYTSPPLAPDKATQISTGGVKTSSRDPTDERDPDVIPAKFEPPPVLGNGTLQRTQPPDDQSMHWPTQQQQQYSWELRPKELRLESISPPTPSSLNAVPTTVVVPASAVGSATSKDIELNGTAIKERLMASRLPESCV